MLGLPPAFAGVDPTYARDPRMPEPFDPASHRFGPSRYFEDFTLGETFHIPSRTVTEAQFLAFQAASGDNHPIHYDREFCRRHGHPDLLAHGFQVLIQTAAGAGLFPFLVEESLIGFIEQSSRFLRPVHAGDTLYPRLAVAGLKPQRTTGVLTLASTVHNQKGELVLEGEQKYPPEAPRAAGAERTQAGAAMLAGLLARDEVGRARGNAVLDEIVRAYGEPHRHYHTLDHIAQLLGLLERTARRITELDAVMLAILFHDAVYVATAPRTSARAPRLRPNALPLWAFATRSRRAGRALHPRHPARSGRRRPDGRTSPCCSTSTFDPGSAGRRLSHLRRCHKARVWVGARRALPAGTTAVLEGFLARERIYRTDRLHALWEARARANLAAEIAELA